MMNLKKKFAALAAAVTLAVGVAALAAPALAEEPDNVPAVTEQQPAQNTEATDNQVQHKDGVNKSAGLNVAEKKFFEKEYTVAGAEVEVKNGNLKAKAEAEGIKTSVSADARAGITNGNITASASASASVTLGSASTSVTYGTDEANGKLKGTVDVGKTEIKAGAKFKAGDHVEAEIGLHGNANLAEASAEASASANGTSIKVKGGVTVGVGVDVGVEFKDGKVKFEGGASVGVGFKVGVEVDVSKTGLGNDGIERNVEMDIEKAGSRNIEEEITNAGRNENPGVQFGGNDGMGFGDIGFNFGGPVELF